MMNNSFASITLSIFESDIAEGFLDPYQPDPIQQNQILNIVVVAEIKQWQPSTLAQEKFIPNPAKPGDYCLNLFVKSVFGVQGDYQNQIWALSVYQNVPILLSWPFQKDNSTTEISAETWIEANVTLVFDTQRLGGDSSYILVDPLHLPELYQTFRVLQRTGQGHGGTMTLKPEFSFKYWPHYTAHSLFRKETYTQFFETPFLITYSHGSSDFYQAALIQSESPQFVQVGQNFSTPLYAVIENCVWNAPSGTFQLKHLYWNTHYFYGQICEVYSEQQHTYCVLDVGLLKLILKADEIPEPEEKNIESGLWLSGTLFLWIPPAHFPHFQGSHFHVRQLIPIQKMLHLPEKRAYITESPVQDSQQDLFLELELVSQC
jgi:hypothetical protein